MITTTITTTTTSTTTTRSTTGDEGMHAENAGGGSIGDRHNAGGGSIGLEPLEEAAVTWDYEC